MELLLEKKEVRYENADFVKAPVDASYDEKVHTLLFNTLVANEYHISTGGINYETYIEAQNNKLQFHKDLLGGEKIIEIKNSIQEVEYYKVMFKSIMEKLVNNTIYSLITSVKFNGLSFKDREMFFDYINTIFTEQVLVENKLPENIIVDFTDVIKREESFIRGHENRESIIANPIKKYQTGMKLTRFFVSIAELWRSKDKDMEKSIGRFRIDPNDKVGVFISAYLPSFIKAGSIGNSCLSHGGVNEHSTFMTVGYPNVVLVHDADFAYRAWLAVDYKNKYYTLAHTYPRENFYLQLMVHSFLKAEGYTQISSYFSFPEYMDMGAAQEFREGIKQADSWDNRDAYFNYSSSLFQNFSDPDEGRIAYVYSCSGCDKSSVSSDFLEDGDYCDSCANNENDDDYFTCARCDEREHNDYSNYDEDTEEYYCNSCHEHLLEERKEQEESEGEVSELTSVTIDYTLIKNAPRDQFYGMLPKIVEMGSKLIGPKDLDILSKRFSKISNKREFEIYAALAEAAGVKWMDGSVPSEWNPTIKRERVTYPFYVSLVKDSGAPYSIYYNKPDQAQEDSKPKDEFYLRYFYLARNKIYSQLENERPADIMSLNYEDTWLNAENNKYFTQGYTLADAVDLFKIDNNRQTEFTFDSLETLQMGLYMLNTLGYRSVTLQNVLFTNYTRNYNEIYFVLDNKGRLYEYNLPSDIEKNTITKNNFEMLFTPQ